MTQRLLDFLQANAGDFFHPTQLARQLNATPAGLLRSILELRRTRRLRSRGACCCINMRYWGV